MYNLLRFYNQNRGKFWFIVIVIIFIFVIIQLFNFFAERQLEDETENTMSNNSTVTTNRYEEKSKSMVSGGSVDSAYQEEFTKLLDDFLSNCISGNYQQAYQLLSKECKEELYPTEKSFRINYCDGKFDTGKEYDFQSWISDKAIIYQIRIYNNILQSGNANTNYIEDYYTIIKEKDDYKINISGFVDKENYSNTQGSYENINVKVTSISDYMNYEIVEMKIENKSEKTIMLDSKENTDTVYIIDSNGNKNYALLNENEDDDLIISSNSSKEISVKFAKPYQSELSTRKICYSNMVLDYDIFTSSNEDYNNYGSIEIQL